MSKGYYVISGMDAAGWYKLTTNLESLGLEFMLFGFSNKEPHVFLTEALAEQLRVNYNLRLDGPYYRID